MKSINIILSAFMLMTIALASCKAEPVQQSQEKDLWSSYLQYRDSTDADMLGMLEQMNSNIEFGKYQGSNPLTPNIITEMPELFFIASYNNIVRNGSCLFGHDGNLEEMSIFPLPFDNE